jgi:NAD(P)-dependent dehydrogenase (short-subunit alcohol dehydrogenase family)
MSTDLTSQVVVVTGGASGIGEAIVRLCAERHATVVIADIAPDPASALAAEVAGHAVTLDVTSEEDVRAVAADIQRDLGGVDALITSAGITQPPLAPETLEQPNWDAVLSVDLRGTWLCATAFGRQMAVRGHGSIVTIASVAGMRSMPLHAYTPAKAAVIALTANLATEWGRSGVRVNCISPGYTQTPLLRDQIDRGLRDPTNLTEESALGRMVEPREVAHAACFLASEDAAGITGINLPVDAGWLVTPSWHTYNGIPAARHTG